MFSVFTNISNKQTKGPTLMELFTATGKLKKFFSFWQLEIYNVCVTGDMAHIDTIFKFVPHTRQLGEHYETPCIFDTILEDRKFWTEW